MQKQRACAGAIVALGSDLEAGSGEPLSKPIYQLVEGHGAYAGVSFDGHIIGARNDNDEADYGGRVTPGDIVIARRHRQPESDALFRALALRGSASSSASNRDTLLEGDKDSQRVSVG